MTQLPQKNQPARKPRRLLAKLALSVASLLFMFAVAEVTLRAIGARPRSAQVLIGFFKPDPHLGWAGRENVSMWFNSSSFNAITSHDANGFRCCGLPTAIESDADHQGEVVWCLGDSFTWSWGVDDEKTWVSLLNQMSTDGRIYRNLGSPCFSTYQEYLLLKDQLDRGHKPDRVVLMFTSNDLDDNVNDNPIAPHFAVVDGKPQLRNHPVQGRWRCDFRVWLKQNSLAYNYLNFYFARAKSAVKERLEKEPDVAHAGVPGKPSDAGDDRVTVLREVVVMLKQLCQEHDVDLIIATHDHDRWMPQICRELHLPLIDLSGDFDKHITAHSDPTKIPGDGHWSELGNRVAADGLHRELEKLLIARQEERQEKLGRKIR